MPASGPLHPETDEGVAIDATFELSTLPVFEVVYHHKAGARGSARSVNADYHQGLEVLLTRLGRLRLTILGISVDSQAAREVEPADRELALDFPIPLTPSMPFKDLRLSITRAQKSIARRGTAKPGGGNDQKRIRITFAGDDPTLTYEQLRRVLVGGLSHSEIARFDVHNSTTN